MITDSVYICPEYCNLGLLNYLILHAVNMNINLTKTVHLLILLVRHRILIFWKNNGLLVSII